MNDKNTNSILRMISFMTTFALLIAINTHTSLSRFFYILGDNIGNADVLIDGKFNTFFISSLGMTSFIIMATYLLIVRCQTLFAKILIIVADIGLLIMVFTLTQARVMHNFIADTQVTDVVKAAFNESNVLMGTSDTTLLTIVLVHMVIMLVGVIRAYKSREGRFLDKASVYD